MKQVHFIRQNVGGVDYRFALDSGRFIIGWWPHTSNGTIDGPLVHGWHVSSAPLSWDGWPEPCGLRWPEERAS